MSVILNEIQGGSLTFFNTVSISILPSWFTRMD
jgi:hypothetical protein